MTDKTDKDTDSGKDKNEKTEEVESKKESKEEQKGEDSESKGKEKKEKKERKKRKKPEANGETPAKAEGEGRPKRERKSVTKFKFEEKKADKELDIPKGEGVPLADHPNIVTNLSKLKLDDPALKKVHRVLFSTSGKKLTLKRNIRKFSGFPAGDDATKTKADLEARLEKFSQSDIVDIAKILDASGTTGLKGKELNDALIKFLIKPKPGKEVTGGTLGKRRRSTTGKGSKGSKKSKTKGKKKSKTKGTRGASGYIIFSNEVRPKIKKKDPGLSFAEVAQAIAKKWKKLDDDEKEEYNKKAKALKKEKDDAGSDSDESSKKKKKKTKKKKAKEEETDDESEEEEEEEEEEEVET